MLHNSYFLRQIEVANCRWTMEADTISKNGASLKSKVNFLYVVCFVLVTIISGCGKDNDEKVKLVKTVSGVHETLSFEYDSQNRITKIINDNRENMYTTFTYSGFDLVKVTLFWPSGYYGIYENNIVRNGNTITVNYRVGSSTITVNNNGYPTNFEETGRDWSVEYDQNCNLINATIRDIYYDEEWVSKFIYGNEKSPFYHCKTPKWWTIVYDVGFEIYFIQKNNVTEIIGWDGNDITLKFKYEFDSDGYPTKIEKENSEENSGITFTYMTK